jgi:dihydrofolate reductase
MRSCTNTTVPGAGVTMSKVFSSLAASLDGFIQSPSGDLSWLNDSMAKGEDYGFERITERTGVYVMGANTYREMGVMMGGSAVPTYVVAHDGSLKTGKHTHLYSGSLEELVKTVRVGLDPAKDIYVFGGGILVSRFIELGLLDELTVAIVPVILGGGVPLFEHMSASKRLKLTSCQQFKSGIVIINYRIAGQAPAPDDGPGGVR